MRRPDRPLHVLLIADAAEHPSSIYRGAWPIGAMEAIGAAKVAKHSWPGLKPMEPDDPEFDELVKKAEAQEIEFSKDFLRDLAGAEVIVLPQTALLVWMSLIQVWQRAGKVVVMDADDDSFNTHPLSPTYAVRGMEECDIRLNEEVVLRWRDVHGEDCEGRTEEELLSEKPPISRMWLKRNRLAMGMYQKGLLTADAITTTTARAAERFREFNLNVFVLPNSVDTDLYIPGRHPGRPGFRLAWFGGSSHQMDCQFAGKAVGEFAHRHPDVRVVMAGSVLSTVARHVPEGQLEFLDWSCMEAHPWRLMGIAADLGFCAVTPGTKFNACKSPVKWTEFGAVGVPTVCTNAPPYSDAVRHGEDGWLVEDTVEAWLDAFERFYADADLRKSIGRAARARMVQDFDLHRNARLWHEVYCDLIEARCVEDSPAPVEA